MSSILLSPCLPCDWVRIKNILARGQDLRESIQRRAPRIGRVSPPNSAGPHPTLCVGAVQEPHDWLHWWLTRPVSVSDCPKERNLQSGRMKDGTKAPHGREGPREVTRSSSEKVLPREGTFGKSSPLPFGPMSRQVDGDCNIYVRRTTYILFKVAHLDILPAS